MLAGLLSGCGRNATNLTADVVLVPDGYFIPDESLSFLEIENPEERHLVFEKKAIRVQGGRYLISASALEFMLKKVADAERIE